MSKFLIFLLFPLVAIGFGTYTVTKTDRITPNTEAQVTVESALRLDANAADRVLYTDANQDVSDSALLTFDGSDLLFPITNGSFLVGDGSGVKSEVAISGDITISNSGVAAIESGVIVNGDVNASAAIDATKIHNGTVDNTEFGYLDNVTSSIQTQINSKITDPANLTSQVTGVLPIANGGTGSSTQNFIDLTTSQSIGGVKTFSDSVNVDNLNLNGNAISATDTNGNIDLIGNGTGDVRLIDATNGNLASYDSSLNKLYVRDVSTDVQGDYGIDQIVLNSAAIDATDTSLIFKASSDASQSSTYSSEISRNASINGNLEINNKGGGAILLRNATETTGLTIDRLGALDMLIDFGGTDYAHQLGAFYFEMNSSNNDQTTLIDFHASSDVSQGDYSVRLVRNSGINGEVAIANRGVGSIVLYQESSAKGLYVLANGDVVFTGTGGLELPTGTTGERPTCVDGVIRYNTTTAKFEGCAASTWVDFH